MRITDRADRHFWIPGKYTFRRCEPGKLSYLGAKMHRCRCCKFPHSLCVAQFSSRFPTIRSAIARKWPCLRSVAPRLWRFPGITVCKKMLRGEQKLRKIPHKNHISAPTPKISGAANADRQSEIAVSWPISDVRSSFSSYR